MESNCGTLLLVLIGSIVVSGQAINDSTSDDKFHSRHWKHGGNYMGNWPAADDDHPGCSGSMIATEVSSIGSTFGPPTDPPPPDCHSYMTSNEFQPLGSSHDDRSYFRGGTDLDRQNLYPCKVNINGKVFLGRGKVSEGRCWFGFEDLIETSVKAAQASFLRRPSNIRLIWHHARLDTLDSLQNLVYAKHPSDGGDNRGLIIARTSFQVPADSEPDCKIDYNAPEVLIPGVIELPDGTLGSARFRFTFGTRVYTGTEFEVLTCQDYST